MYDKKKKILFILSTNYAGSHYLSLLVGSHSKAVHVGELHRFRREHVRKEPCYACGDFRKCPVFRGIVPGKIQDIYQTLFDNVGPDIDVLVDNSKKPAWAEHFVADDRIEKRFVHLIRDPRALIRRWDMGYNTARKRWHQRWKLVRRRPANALSLLLASPRQVYVHKWLLQNQAITNFLQRHRFDHVLMTYRDLAKNTGAELEKLMAWLGLEFEPAQVEYWNFEHHGTQKSEYEWIKEKKGSYFDTRWKDYLSAQEQQNIMDHPSIVDYLKRIGINIADDGLTRASRRENAPAQSVR